MNTGDLFIAAVALVAWNLGRGDLRGAVSVAVVWALVRLSVGYAARRRARRRSWAHDPVMVRPYDWRRD